MAIKYCKICTYPNTHPLNLYFYDDGICSGCKIHYEKDILDWNERKKKLLKIIEPYKKIKTGKHNCIVPISGGKDSYFIIDYVKNTLNMHPLVVYHNIHYNTFTGHHNISNIQSTLGLDLITQISNPKIVKKITRYTLKKICSIYWHCISGYTVFPIKIAAKFKIPLIIWGAHQGVDQVGMFSHTDEVEMTRKYRKEHDLMNFEAEDLIDKGGLTESDLEDYLYPTDKEISEVGIRGIYLNNYVRWDSKMQHEKMIQKYNYKTNIQTRTFDRYNDVNSIHYSGVHDYIKFIKNGYGKITDHCTREIRLKRLSRENAVQLIYKYNNKEIDDLNLFLEWLKMSKKDFFQIVNKFRNKSFWYKKNNKWLNKNLIYQDKNKMSKFVEDPLFINNDIDKSYNDDHYDLINKAWL